VAQQINQCGGRQTLELGVRTPFGLLERFEITLSGRQQEQAVGGNGGGWLALHTVGIAYLSFADTQETFLITKINFDIPTPEIVLQQRLDA